MTKPKTIKVRVPGVVAPDGRSEHVEKINPSVMRALRAVERGEVFRLIQNSASKMQGPMGIGPIQFWRCQWAKLIEDGPRIGVGPGSRDSNWWSAGAVAGIGAHGVAVDGDELRHRRQWMRCQNRSGLLPGCAV